MYGIGSSCMDQLNQGDLNKKMTSVGASIMEYIQKQKTHLVGITSIGALYDT